MSTVFTFPGKIGDAILQFPVAYHWAQQTGEHFDVWLDEGTCAPLVPLLNAQPGVAEVKLIPGVESYHCGGQPFHMNLPTSAFADNTVYHLGLRGFPVRQISLQTLNDSKVPIKVDPNVFANTPYLEVGPVEKKNRLVVHGKAVYPHSRTTPTMWRFLSSIKPEIERIFDEVVFVGTADDREVGHKAYPEWNEYDDGGDFLALARFIAGSRCMIGIGSSPITLAGALKVPGIRVHDTIGDDAPRVIWSNLGDNQLNETYIGLRAEWPRFRDRWLNPVDASVPQS